MAAGKSSGSWESFMNLSIGRTGSTQMLLCHTPCLQPTGMVHTIEMTILVVQTKRHHSGKLILNKFELTTYKIRTVETELTSVSTFLYRKKVFMH